MMAAPFERPLGVNTEEATQVFKSSSQAVLAAKDTNKESGYLEGAKRVLKYMYNLWQNDKMCDLNLECNGGRLNAHKVALGAYSEKLSNNFAEYPITELLTIDLREFSKESVHVILVFVYTTELNVTIVNVAEVLSCATELDISYVKNSCLSFLSDNISVTTVFVFMDVAARHGLTDLQTRLDAFLSKHFGEIINTDGFLNISGDRLMRLLSDHRISRQVGELAVFLAVVRWVEYRRSERQSLFPGLMRLISFILISPQDLINHVETVNLVTNNMETFQMLYSAMSWHAVKANGADVFLMNNNRVYHDTTASSWMANYPGAPYLGHLAMAQMAQSNPTQMQSSPQPPAVPVPPTPFVPSAAPMPPTSTSRTVQLTQGQTSGYNMIPRAKPAQGQSQGQPPQGQNQGQGQSNHQEEQAHLQGAMHHTISTNVNSKYTSVAHFTPTDAAVSGGNNRLVVVAVGGVELETSNVNIPGRAVFQYNPGQQGGSWTSLTTLPHSTNHHGVALLGNKLYVVGGAVYTPNPQGCLGNALSTVNVYDINTQRWSEAAPMIFRRTYLSVVADNNFIYAVGGEDENRNRLDSVERYDPRFNRWTHVTNMPSGGKVGQACAVYNNKLYVVGGYNSARGGHPVMENVECFDLNSNQWIIKRNLPQPRCHASLVVAMGKMYLIGGRTRNAGYGVYSMASILCYDESADIWQHVANLNNPRHDAGCAAIGSNIYVVGGIRSPSPTCLAAVECWDCISGQWRPQVPNLPYTAAGLSCCAVRL